MSNNHALDYGKKGFYDTLNDIEQQKLSYFGAGVNETQARGGFIKTYDDQTTIGYLGYFEYRTSYDYYYQFYAV